MLTTDYAPTVESPPELQAAPIPGKGQLNVRLTAELIEAITEAAAVLGISQAALVEIAMRERVGGILGRPVPPAAPQHRKRAAAP